MVLNGTRGADPIKFGGMAMTILATHARTGEARSEPRTAYRKFGVTGMTCAGEAAGLERRLHQRPGILKATVNPITECAYITYDPASIDPPALISAIEAA